MHKIESRFYFSFLCFATYIENRNTHFLNRYIEFESRNISH